MYTIPFTNIDWSQIEKVEHPGKTGIATWQTLNLDGLRIRIVTYSAGYLADHWCQKGHIVYCLAGSFVSEWKMGQHSHLARG